MFAIRKINSRGIYYLPPIEFFLYASKNKESGEDTIPILAPRPRLGTIGKNYTIDFEQFEKEAVKPENTLLLLCSPNNPTGRVWTEEELRRTAEICFKHNVSIFVDEIHNDIVRKGINMISLTALYPGDKRLVTCSI